MMVRSPTYRAGASYHVYARDYLEALDLVAERFCKTFRCPRYVAVANVEVSSYNPNSDETVSSIRTIRKWK